MAAEFLAQSEQDNALRRLYAAEVPSPPPVGPAQTPWSSPRPARDTIVLRVRLERSRSEALRHQRLAIAHTLNAESLEDAARRADPQPSAYQHSLTSGILPAIPLIGAASYFDRADQAYDNAADEWAKAEREWRDMAAIWEAPI